MLALSRNHDCQVFSAQNNHLLENLAFTDDVSSVLLIFIIVSDICYIEMILPSVASYDFARTHPSFRASYRSLKNSKKKALQKVISCTCKVLIKSDISEPRRPKKDPFGPIFLEWNLPIECFSFSEDQSRFLSHLRMLCIYITAYYSALPTFHSRRAAFYRYLSHLRMTCRFVSLCTRNPGFHSSNPRSARALRLSRFRPSFRIVLADVCGPECRKTSLCAVFAKIAFSPTPNAKAKYKISTPLEWYARLSQRR